MRLDVAIQMDPVETINVTADSTFVLALEAQARGHRLYHYLPRQLSLVDGRVIAQARRFRVWRDKKRHAALGEVETLDLARMNVILMRQDPPFDMAYITATHILEHVRGKVLVVNDPVAVRNAPEKLFATHFPGLMPPTLVSTDRGAIVARQRLPAHEFLVGDMRSLRLSRQFDGVLAWDSFFHLTPDDQRRMFDVFAQHAAPSAVLMFNSGPTHGEGVGQYRGDPLYHASLSPEEYTALLGGIGFDVLAHAVEDWKTGGGRTVWLARAGDTAGR